MHIFVGKINTFPFNYCWFLLIYIHDAGWAIHHNAHQIKNPPSIKHILLDCNTFMKNLPIQLK